MRENDIGAKAIVFSQFVNFLDVCFVYFYNAAVASCVTFSIFFLLLAAH
jgi:hypothetical protein